MSDDIKKLETAAYQRGYAAGKKKRQAQAAADRQFAIDTAFLHRAFLAVLPVAMDSQGWKTGQKPITGLEARVKLAWDFADEALKQRRHP